MEGGKEGDYVQGGGVWVVHTHAQTKYETHQDFHE